MAVTPLAAMSGVPYKLQDTQSTGNGNILAIPPSFRNHTFTIQGAAGVTSGAVTIEHSNDYTNAGTWGLVVATAQTVVASTDILITVTGLFNFIRARISTTIAGGAAPSVTVIYEGAKSY
jgi:hypothetical protein